MSAGDWIGVIGIACTVTGAAWFIIMIAVDNKIADALSKLKDERIRELAEHLDEEKRKNDYLKSRIQDLK